MQARLQFNRFPTLVISVMFVLAAAIILGGTLGYLLKPSTLVPGRTQVLVVHDYPDSNPRADACLWFNGHKHC